MKTPTTRPVRSADEVAAQWVVRRRAGMDAAAEAELQAWLDLAVEHKEIFSRLSSMSDVFQRARATGAATQIVTQLQRRARQRRSRRAVTAGGIVALLIAGVTWWQWSAPAPAVEPSATLASGNEPIRRLTDGSIVELKPGAEIVPQFERSVRRVELRRGEALFRVEKDPARPFIVRANGVDVRAVGTAFNVRLGSTSVEILVTEGKVQVADAFRGRSLVPASDAAEPAVVRAGQEIVVQTEQLATTPVMGQVAELTAAEIKQQLSWRVPHLEFDAVDLATAVRRINAENRLQIVLADESLGALHVSGTFSPDDPATFARLVAATFGLRSEQHGEESIVLRKE